MKEFQPIVFDVKACQTQLWRFRKLLNERASLRENADILPFFKENPQLAAFIGGRFPELIHQDRIAFEFDLFGDFACDLVIGNSQTETFCFVEFEDGAPDGIFRRVGAKSTPEWSPRFDHGFSQIVDWLWKLDEMRPTPAFSDRFGAVLPSFHGLLVVGRDVGLEAREQRRLKWRMKKILVDSHSVACVTFDQLYLEMENRLSWRKTKKE